MKQLLFLILLFNLSACKVQEKRLEYPNGVAYFDKRFYNWFPTNVGIPYTIEVSQDISESHPYIWLKFTLTQERYDSTLNALESSHVAKYYSDDSCLLVIDKHLKPDNWWKYDKSLRVPRKVAYGDKLCHEGKLPVPNFYSDFWNETSKNDTGLEDYVLYVLEAKPGIYMDSLKLPNVLYTPKGWEHGYSKGVALKEANREIIYWADIW